MLGHQPSIDQVDGPRLALHVFSLHNAFVKIDQDIAAQMLLIQEVSLDEVNLRAVPFLFSTRTLGVP